MRPGRGFQVPKRITPGQIKKNNRQQIYNHIYRGGKVSQQDIAYALRLSRPTVATNLAELEEDGLIRKNGQLESDQIGRKAAAYSIVENARVAIGVELMRALVKIIAVDLYGHKLRREVVETPYANDPDYYRGVCRSIRRFIDALDVPADRVLGVGIAMQGLVSSDGRSIVYGAILDCTGLKIDAFEQWLGLPCTFIHDPDGAALSELWVSEDITDAVYLSLSRHLGGSLISGGRIITGKHGHSATFEHIQARPRGELCYCGKRGCWETLCSMKALLGDQDPDAFFAAVRRGDEAPARRWNTYLKDLSRLIGGLHLVQDSLFIMGGHLAPYITEDDIRFIYREIRQMCPFVDRDDFIRVSKMPSHNITIGASLPYIRAFLDDIDADRPAV